MKANLIILTFTAAMLVGCVTRPLRPGTATIKSAAPAGGAQFASELKQPENPAQAAAQNFERTTETSLPLPAGTKVAERILTRERPDGPGVVTEKTIVLSAPAVQATRTVEKAGTTIGAAQKDTARELGAKLASLKGIVWVGVLMFIFGIATLVYPPLRSIIGSVTTSVAVIVGGIALMVLPTLIVGNELLILGGVAALVGGWFFAHRYGRLRGFVDANKNGIDDRLEEGTAKAEQ
ncbi:MAG TPA: hypothetical protein VK530_08565 [Candidatus Acidoferrum sp.]|nr:hypothetical protein [Candidatus Acidoferrum sp.]